MSKQKAKEMLAWLEANYPNASFTLADLKELLDIDRLAEPGIFGPMYEHFTNKMIEEEIARQKASGEYYELDRKVEAFKAKIKNRTEQRL
jgi:hypothetical protein